jgi:hypothetical protein
MMVQAAREDTATRNNNDAKTARKPPDKSVADKQQNASVYTQGGHECCDK